MNYHQRSLSEQPQSLRPQLSPSFMNNNNNNNNNGPVVSMDTTSGGGGGGGEILHSDSQQSLDRLFNPSSMSSHPPLRDRNLPKSFFNPPSRTSLANGDSNQDNKDRQPVSFHCRSVSFDHRNKPAQRLGGGFHMRTQSTLAPMTGTSLMGRAAAIAESSAGGSPAPVTQVRGSTSNGRLHSDFGSSTEFMPSPMHSNNDLHGSTEFNHHHRHHNQFIQPSDNANNQGQQQQAFATDRSASIVHARQVTATQPTATSYGLDQQNNMANQHHLIQQSQEPKFHVAHSTYVTPQPSITVFHQNNQQQQFHPTTSVNLSSLNGSTNQLCQNGGYSSPSESASIMSHSCSNGDFQQNGPCSTTSLHSRSLSCQSSVLDSSMSNLGIGGGSSSDLTAPDSTSSTTMAQAPMATGADYAPAPLMQQHHHLSYNQQPGQQQIFGSQPLMSQQQQQTHFHHNPNAAALHSTQHHHHSQQQPQPTPQHHHQQQQQIFSSQPVVNQRAHQFHNHHHNPLPGLHQHQHQQQQQHHPAPTSLQHQHHQHHHQQQQQQQPLHQHQHYPPLNGIDDWSTMATAVAASAAPTSSYVKVQTANM